MNQSSLTFTNPAKSRNKTSYFYWARALLLFVMLLFDSLNVLRLKNVLCYKYYVSLGQFDVGLCHPLSYILCILNSIPFLQGVPCM